jgi:hypothetical protein
VETYALRESSEVYAGDFSGKNDALRLENAIAWDENAEVTEI